MVGKRGISGFLPMARSGVRPVLVTGRRARGGITPISVMPPGWRSKGRGAHSHRSGRLGFIALSVDLQRIEGAFRTQAGEQKIAPPRAARVRRPRHARPERLVPLPPDDVGIAPETGRGGHSQGMSADGYFRTFDHSPRHAPFAPETGRDGPPPQMSVNNPKTDAGS